MTSKTNEPMPVERPGQEPAPTTPAERPRRRTFIQPTFKRFQTLSAGVLALGMLVAQAQSTPQPATPTKPSTPGQPTRPIMTQDPATQQPQGDRGWVMFDDRVGADLGIDNATLQRLREVDARYEKDYAALGETPYTHRDYRILSDRRSMDVKGILTADQYKRWSQQYNRMPATRNQAMPDTDTRPKSE